ncbi:MAG: class I SAM-dependent methyltransferase [Solirubrobacteraceae bacterium]
MRAAAAERVQAGYALARAPQEYERLRAQSRVWEAATTRVLDGVGLAPGQRCLDAGCGPGETMRLMAERVGRSGSVTGVDVDATVGEAAVAMLRAHGHDQCRFAQADLTADRSIARGRFDLVYARLLLYHLPDRVGVLRRLWEAVAPGGHLVIQDYDVRSVDVVPALETVEEFKRVVVAAFSAAGCDVHVGARLPELFARAGVGTPDGTDVAGRLERLADAQTLFTGVYSGVLSTAIAQGVSSQQRAAMWRAEFARDVERFPDRPAFWPLLVGAWKRKPESARSGHGCPTPG